ncbi:MAG: ASPIC/UnbV domain-containing protein [Verrucomicrobiota bacterium]|nr:ASPIC/UnbV domain-containing protein [Verrucomicrobiota bacterium]
MRSDPGKGNSLNQSKAFKETTRRAATQLNSDRWGKDSLSGKERNRLFLNRDGRQFSDISMLSGADHVGDGRSVVLLDYNHDGKTDIASVNTNAPKLVLFRNEALAEENHFIALRLVGGNRSNQARPGFSNRDGYGARITLHCGARSFVEEHRCGEGYSAQNSNTLLIGIGKANGVDSATIRWPGGKTQELPALPAGKLITVYEEGGSGNDKPFTITPYIAAGDSPGQGSTATADTSLPVFSPAGATSEAPLRLFTLSATWCEACKRELPQLARIRSHFPAGQLAMFGLPGDEKETPAQWQAYAEKYRPGYRMLPGISAAERKAMHNALGEAADILPASMVTTQGGQVLLITKGLPTLSQIARIMIKISP